MEAEMAPLLANLVEFLLPGPTTFDLLSEGLGS